MPMQSETRTAILVAARERLEAVGPARLRMADIARAAGVSRQSVYLHFGSRGVLLVALMELIDHTEGLDELVRWVFAAEESGELLDRVVEMQTVYNPRIDSVAAALEAAASADADAAAAWLNRMDSRLEGAREVIRRFAVQDALAPALTESAAVDLLWSMTSLATWRSLVVARGWSGEAYEERMKRVLRRVLLK
ncbi:MAG: helix-turn-helix domain-containing protein [Gemmatimonadota bacterium]